MKSYDEMSIKELCTPISAKVMPKRLLFSSGNAERDNDEAFAKSRIAQSVAAHTKLSSRKKYKS